MRIFINNEEVVSNSNLTIKEEILSTSSTILKNCYPKSWEDDKDYTSRYYFPKDFAKCKIEFDEASFEIVGNSSQNGTPTPNNPVPIISKTGNITQRINGLDYTFSLGDIELCKYLNPYYVSEGTDYIAKSTGKNLFNKNEIEIDKKLDTDGTVGDELGYTTSDYITVSENNQYWLSYYASMLPNVRIAYYDEDRNFINYYDADSPSRHSKFSFTTPSDTQYLRFSYETLILKTIQLEKGSSNTRYEPYGEEWFIEKWVGRVDIDTKDITRSTYSNVDYAVITMPNDCMSYGEYALWNVYSSHAKFKAFQTLNNASNVDFIGNTTSSPVTTWLIGFPHGTSLADMKQALEGAYIEYPRKYADVTIINENNYPVLYNQLIRFDGQLIFCGLAKNTGNVSLNPREFHGIDLQILDFKDLLSTGETLNYVITNKTIREAIEQVVSSIADYGFIVGNINILNPDDIINAYSTLNKTAYDVFQYIADISGSRWFTRMIDENTVAIDFYDPSMMESGLDIEHTQEFFEDNEIVDMTFNYSTNDYRNKQIMTSDEVIANITQTESIVADGYSKTFMCQNKLGTITSITVDGVSKSFVTKAQEESGASGDFIYQPGDTIFTSTQTVSTGGLIVITYYPIVKGREIILESSEKSRIENQIGRNGTISRYENRNDTTSSEELQKIGQSYIKYKGKPEITLKVTSTKDLWNIGEIISYDAPLSDLTTDYMLKNKKIDMYLNANKVMYTYEFTSNFNCENAVNYFDNQRAKSQGNIGEGEFITRNIDLESTATIKFYDTDIEEVEVGNYTSLDFGLDGVLI